MNPSEKIEPQRQKIDRIYYTDSQGHPVSEEYDKPCPKCGGRCIVHRALDGTAGYERCRVCDFYLRW